MMIEKKQRSCNLDVIRIFAFLCVYGVEQYALLTENCIIDIRGNFVLFVVNADCDAAQKAFAGAL